MLSLFITDTSPRSNRPFMPRDVWPARQPEVFGVLMAYAFSIGKRGNPVLWSAQYFPRLLELRGDQGARALFREFADHIFEVEMPDDAVLVDIDTQAALDAVRTRFAQAEAISIAYRISVLEPREGLIESPTPSPPPVGRGNKLLDSRYFFPSQREGIEGWARAYRKPKRDGYTQDVH
jgi:hypothetical protein